MPSDSAQAAPINEIKDVPVVILCGGMGGRMGDIAKMLPKALVPIQEYPILWYIILSLYKEGFRTFVLPLGYRGQMIHEYVMSHLASLPNIRFQCIETGESPKSSGEDGISGHAGNPRTWTKAGNALDLAEAEPEGRSWVEAGSIRSYRIRENASASSVSRTG